MTTFSHLLQRQVTENPERISVTLQQSGADDLPLTYRSLYEGAISYFNTYQREGIQPGDVVVLIFQHGRDLIHSYWGAVFLGAIPSVLPFLTEKLSPERYQADLASLISITRPAAIVTYREFEANVRGALREGDSVRALICSDAIETTSAAAWDALPGLRRSPDDVALLQHSSGSTGLQKGVALSHRAVINQLETYGRSLGLNREDVIVSWLPLYHDMGLIAGFLMPILFGVPLVLQSPFDWIGAPYILPQAVSRHKGTLTWLPNFAYNFCAQKIRDRHLADVDLSSWRAVINCSEPVKKDSHQAFYERFKNFGLRPTAMQTCYAMAENVFAVTQSDLAAEPVHEAVDRESFFFERVARLAYDGRPAITLMSSGKPLESVKVRILNERGHDVAERTVGEIALQSDCMLTGYYNRPEVTEKAFLDGWYLTGDFGYLANGELFVTGRKKDMIIVGGKNIYPQDLEALVSETPGVHAGRVVAFGVFDESAGTEEVVIVAEVEAEDPAQRQEIGEAVRLMVSKNTAVVPRQVYLVGPKWIVKTSSGKVARSANREKYLKEIQAK
ncbi:MAG: AMP-binding protein [Chloroflexi bacterium]|nr:AMP-binding protein [Chloroflexota bacterium]